MSQLTLVVTPERSGWVSLPPRLCNQLYGMPTPLPLVLQLTPTDPATGAKSAATRLQRPPVTADAALETWPHTHCVPRACCASKQPGTTVPLRPLSAVPSAHLRGS